MKAGAARRPPAPWGSFPLTELTVLAAFCLAMAAFLWWGSERAVWAALGAAVIGSLAGLEVSLREHLSGYRRHSGVLSSAAMGALTVGAAVAGAPAHVLLPVAAGGFAAAYLAFETAFRRTIRQIGLEGWRSARIRRTKGR